ncbi:cobalamin-independent methionine synthase II family protein [Ammoniphilus resinae]|uniref:5-methyltetrahydropteroyltriglutamate--homocysteine methyltransferase n=1 Tax=Ammoniphilus resinae TaxID=861532 RepID=A0ABS4GIR9_9BACL|nr:cobalamin-independent methionine synthase II family protein [Ammoniphilus resinae]MBP1930152.1 5-methyltetrahydropteroyltriglutamate--homocysteine methyltransferase [Ammoniphilus resinae]
MKLPLFPTTVVGSWPRSREVLLGLREKRAGRMTEDEFQKIADQAALECLKAQEESGIDIVSDGEQRRDNFISFVADKLENVRMLTVAELLDYVEDKASFEEILGTLDVPAFSLSNPAAIGKISRRKPLALDEYQFLRKHTDRAIKVALPGPYLLTRSMWVEGLSAATYPTKESLAEDVVRVLREELEDLIKDGVDFVQFDEPVLTELVFTQKNANRTFMCGALTAKADAEEELTFATGLINQVMEGMRGNGTRIGVHVCRGNWSTQENVLLRGPYSPLMPYLAEMNVDQLILEYATPRAGELEVVKSLQGKELGLGVVNPRTEDVESVQQMVQKAQEAARFLSPEHIFLNPDCGFGTFAQRPMNSIERAKEKLKMMVQAAEILRKQ